MPSFEFGSSPQPVAVSVLGKRSRYMFGHMPRVMFQATLPVAVPRLVRSSSYRVGIIARSSIIRCMSQFQSQAVFRILSHYGVACRANILSALDPYVVSTHRCAPDPTSVPINNNVTIQRRARRQPQHRVSCCTWVAVTDLGPWRSRVTAAVLLLISVG